MLINFVSSKVNLVTVPNDIWLIDTGATTYISFTIQGCLKSRGPIDGERNIYSGNGKRLRWKPLMYLDFI